MDFSEALVTDVPKYVADDNYYFQQKVDGIRGQLVVSPGKKPWFRSKSGDQLQNSTAAKISEPLLAKFGAGTPAGSPEYTVDGEMLDGKWHVFDMTVAGSEGLPWETRMEMAQEWVDQMHKNGLTSIEALPTARTAAEKQALWDAVRKGGGEGVMMKRRDAPYKFGQRTDNILKAKVTATADVVVMERNKGGKDNAVIGVYKNGVLTPVGTVSTIGKEKAAPMKVGDVIEVEYLWAHGGSGKLSQARVKKPRPDKNPLEATDKQFRYVNKDVLDKSAMATPDALGPVAPEASPTPVAPASAAPLGPGHLDRAKVALMAGEKTGIASRVPLLGGKSGSKPEMVTFNNGTKAVLQTASKQRFDQYNLHAKLVEAMGGESSAAIRVGSNKMLVEFVEGGHLERTFGGTPEETKADIKKYRDTINAFGPKASAIWLADFVSSNSDRHTGNWVHRNGTPVSIDLGQARFDGKPVSQFANELVATQDRASGAYDWKTKAYAPLRPERAKQLADGLAAVRHDFEAAGRMDWYDNALKIAASLGAGPDTPSVSTPDAPTPDVPTPVAPTPEPAVKPAAGGMPYANSPRAVSEALKVGSPTKQGRAIAEAAAGGRAQVPAILAKRDPAKIEAGYASMRTAGEGQTYIAVPTGTVASIIADGRFRTMFEGGKGIGVDSETGKSTPGYLGSRRWAEDAMFGVGGGKSVKPAQRPVYGYRAPEPSAKGMVSMYGAFHAELKPAADARTSVTVGDSLNDMSTPVMVSDMAKATPEQLLNVTAAHRLLAFVDDGITPQDGKIGYVEAQVYGGVQSADIARWHVTRSSLVDEIAKRQAQKSIMPQYAAYTETMKSELAAMDSAVVALQEAGFDVTVV